MCNYDLRQNVYLSLLIIRNSKVSFNLMKFYKIGIIEIYNKNEDI